MIQISTDEFNRIARYCAEETRRQYAHVRDPKVALRVALRVAGMIEAWMDALNAQHNGELLSREHILRWGASIEPDKNASGFRVIPIFVGGYEKMKWPLLDRAIENLCQEIDVFDFDALRAYREFEEIHPFEDGNGRTGKIILNWVNGTLLDPIFPPDDFWGPRIVNP